MEALALPVSRSLRPARTIPAESSCGVAASALQRSTAGFLAVTRDDRFIGIVTEAGLRRALEAGSNLDDPVEAFIESGLTVPPYASGADALRQFETMATPGAVVVDDGGVVWGVILPSDLFPKPPARLKPHSIGGMAAPFGVYLTTGLVSGGTSKWGLMASGANLVFLLTVGRIFAHGLMLLFARFHLSPTVVDNADDVLTLAFFAVLMRLSPIAGYHAAEHQVVHAIERGESLTVETVRRMPRVHPRCGTNLATGVMMGSFIAFARFGLPQEVAPLQVALGIAVGLAFWRRAGAFVQYWITTKPASRRQLESGIRSGEQLLERYESSHNLRPSPWRSLSSSGLLHVALGAWLVGSAIAIVFNQLGRLDALGLNVN